MSKLEENSYSILLEDILFSLYFVILCIKYLVLKES